MNECKVNLWYPQMGGYAAKAQVTFAYVTNSNVPEPGCFSALVYHDGEFPLGNHGENYRDLLVELLENVTEWHYEDRGRDTNTCNSCGATGGTQVQHNPHCALKQALDVFDRVADNMPDGTTGLPARLHHCSAEQFVQFGLDVLEVQVQNQKDEKGNPVRVRQLWRDEMVRRLLALPTYNTLE